jgi:hypothetical protein
MPFVIGSSEVKRDLTRGPFEAEEVLRNQDVSASTARQVSRKERRQPTTIEKEADTQRRQVQSLGYRRYCDLHRNEHRRSIAAPEECSSKSQCDD